MNHSERPSKSERPFDSEQPFNDRVAEPRSMAQLGILIEREFSTRIRKRGYWVFTVIGLIILVGLTFLPSLLSYINTRSNTKVVLDDRSQIVAPALVKMVTDSPSKYSFRLEADQTRGVSDFSRAQMQSYLKKHQTSLVVVVNGNQAATASFQFEERGTVDPTVIASLKTLLGQYVMNARVATLPTDARAALSAPVKMTTHQWQNQSQSLDQLWQSRILVYYMLGLLFATIASYGAWVAQGVVEEKTNRIIEMMLVTAKPWQVLFGKVLGIGLVGMLQYVIWMVCMGVVLYLRKSGIGLGGIQLGQLPPGTFVLLPVFFILGYFLYATLYGIAGSLVNRPEEQQMALTPVVMVMLVLFYVTMFAVIPNPTSLFSKIMSFIPLFTPLTMYTRASLSAVPVWQILISIALTLLLNWGLVVYGARVYRRFALRNSGKSSWRVLWQKDTHSV